PSFSKLRTERVTSPNTLATSISIPSSLSLPAMNIVIYLYKSRLLIPHRTVSPRHCERSEAIHLSVREVAMDCFASLAMTVEIVFALSRRIAPEVCIFSFALFKNRGRREDRVLAAPRSRVPLRTARDAHEHT